MNPPLVVEFLDAMRLDGRPVAAIIREKVGRGDLPVVRRTMPGLAIRCKIH